jgi:hypothetical protein
MRDYYSKTPMIFDGKSAPRKFYVRVCFYGPFKKR